MIRLALLLTVTVIGCSSEPKKQTSYPTLEADSDDKVERKRRACPDSVMSGAKEQGGACLDPAVLGQDVVDACAIQLQQAGWNRDEAVEKSIGRAQDRPIVCFRRP